MKSFTSKYNIEETILKIFEVNTDAIATNRGFYYQYLSVLKKWIQNYIDEKDIKTFTEVDDDIKEVGEELIFTQIKCYSSNFSLNSKEVTKSMFNFFILFLKYKDLNEKITFCFSTNTSIAKKEKLLIKWIESIELKDEKLLSDCSNKVEDILIKEINTKKNNKLQKCNTDIEKNNIKSVSEKLKSYIKLNIKEFVNTIVWKFDDVSPEDSIFIIKDEIYQLIRHEKFDNRPISLIFGALLSEIYNTSQKTDKKDRYLNQETISNILNHTDKELEQYKNNKLTALLRVDIESLQYDVKQIKIGQENHEKRLKKHREEIDLLKGISQKKIKKEFPKNMNLLPDFYSIEIYGWEDFLNQTNSILKEKKIISIYSSVGMGKTSFAKKYLKTFTNYDHIIWINTAHSISNSFVSDILLKKNLGIEFSANEDINQRFQFLLNELSQIDGNNLLIIDIQEAKDEKSALNELSSIANWEKLILTRSHLNGTTSEKLPILSFNDTKKIFLANCSRNVINDTLFKSFFNYIDNNLLITELTAKTIENSVDLTLENFFQSLKQQQLDDNEYNIDIDINDENNVIRIFDFIIKKFSVNNLNNDENNYLNFLALLPSNNILVEELIQINGQAHYNKNKITIINILNKFDKKGLIEYTLDKKGINIHKIIQEVIIYNERKKSNPFLSNILFITWLTSRIVEGYNNPDKSFRFLKYAESILNSIKEDYRKSLYQPLLILENELLFSKRFYIKTKKSLTELINLAERAEKYLSSNDINLAVMYNNLGLSYAENGNSKNAIYNFEKALQIFNNNELKCLDKIIITYNNKSNVYLKDKNLKGALDTFEKVQVIRKKHSLYDDQQLGIEYKILAESYILYGNYENALKLLVEGIKIHKSIKISDRNDFLLATYYSLLSDLYLAMENIDDAINSQELGISVLEEMNLQNSEYLYSMYRAVLKLYQFKGLKEKEALVGNKIKLFNKEKYQAI